MVYNIINSKVCLARVYDRFNIDYADWEGRTPDWIESAICDMKVHREYETVTLEKEVIDFKAQLPCDIALIEWIDKLDTTTSDSENKYYSRLYKTTSLSDKSDIRNLYTVLGNGMISLSFETGTIVYHYKRTPRQLDELSGLYFPMIPDVDSLIEAITWYLLTVICQRGHIHPVISLDSKNPYTNPSIMYNGNRGMGIVGFRNKARNDMSKIDRDTQRQISTINQTLIIDSDVNGDLENRRNTNNTYNNIQ